MVEALRRFRMSGELRADGFEDLSALVGRLDDALQTVRDHQVTSVSATLPQPDLVRVELVLEAASWKSAHDLGRHIMTQALAQSGAANDLTVRARPDREPRGGRLEPVGTQLLLA